MSENTPFLWAKSEQANVKEPIESLKENGWRYGDVPAASNVNWVLNKMSADIAALRADLQTQSDVFDAKLTDKADMLKTKISRVSIRQRRHHEFDAGISRQICDMLVELVKCLRQYHPTFPEFRWPVSNDRNRANEG